MAHWIIENIGFGRQNYACSNCGQIYSNVFRDPGTWDECPNCGAKINDDEEDEYESDAVHRPFAKMEKIKEMVGLGEDVETDDHRSIKMAEAKALFRDLFDEELEFEELDFVPKHNTKNIVILSLEKYDQMKADYEQCIDERDRELWRMEQELRGLQELVKAIGITPEIAEKVYPDSVTVDLCENPINYTKRYVIKFDVRR